MGVKLEKSPFRYVCDDKNRFTRRMAMPFAFRDWYGPKQLYKHICDDNPVNRKIFQATGTGQRRLQKFIFWLIFACRASKMSKNMKKSPFAYVCDHKNCFTRHMTIPIVLRDCYDPKQTCKHTWHGHKLRKKSFRAAGSRNRCTQNCTF